MMEDSKSLVYLKLGGSLITDKNQPLTVRHKVLERVSLEISSGLRDNPGLSLVIGHGSGSFGHTVAKEYGTRNGVHKEKDWIGFVEVWHAARKLNQAVVEALFKAGVPIVAFPPSASIVTSSRAITSWNITPLQMALHAGLVPLIAGDVIFDKQMGGTILSTEELFNHLAYTLSPERILIAGIEEGVWEDYPQKQNLIQSINPENLIFYKKGLGGSRSVDVTGGMIQKVVSMLELVKDIPELDIQIFSGLEQGNIYKSLIGQALGTNIARGSGK